MQDKKHNPMKSYTTAPRPSASMKKWVLISMVILAVLVVISALLEKTQIINLYDRTDPTPISQEPVKLPNQPVDESSIDYSPGTSEDNELINQEKEADPTTPTLTPTPSTGNINLTLSRATYNAASNTIGIGGLVNGASEGTCTATATMQGTGQVVTGTGSLINQGTNYGCSFVLTSESFSQTSNWDVTLSLSTRGATAMADNTLTVRTGR
jgi:cytoskeletal protein RodZ